MKRFALALSVFALVSTAVASVAVARPWRAQRVSSRLHADPVSRALRRNPRILLNNYWDGARYRASGRTFSSYEVRFVSRNWDGSFNIYFCGQIYRAISKSYRGKLCLYLGRAPSGPGYLYELIVG